MHFSAMIDTMARASDEATELERSGYDAVLTNETAHDPFLPAAVIADHTTRAEIITGIAVAFARTPMVVAHAAHDLNAFSRGRFTLGLGSQVKAHITRRFAMPWSHPARRMKEFIQALHAIWDCWYDGKPLNFQGEFYSHTLTSPVFTPTDTEFGRPRVVLAAVGELMTQVAGEVADGLLCHSFTTPRYLREVTVPAVEQALMANHRSRNAFRIGGGPFMAVAEREQDLGPAIKAIKERIAFYGSTPAYRSVLDLHGWGDLHIELLQMSKAGRWTEMSTLINDEVLHTFCIVGTPAQAARALADSYSGLLDLVNLRSYLTAGPAAAVMSEFRQLSQGTV
ncbi:MAG: TIGR03617 family F420-dependent LLM class oxidoreductase [Steroidobacteraceae bacterium]